MLEQESFVGSMDGYLSVIQRIETAGLLEGITSPDLECINYAQVYEEKPTPRAIVEASGYRVEVFPGGNDSSLLLYTPRATRIDFGRMASHAQLEDDETIDLMWKFGALVMRNATNELIAKPIVLTTKKNAMSQHPLFVHLLSISTGDKDAIASVKELFTDMNAILNEGIVTVNGHRLPIILEDIGFSCGGMGND